MAAPNARSLNLDVELADEAATAALGRTIAGRVACGDVIALFGELGTGKSVFARAFINALPWPQGTPGDGPEEVPSPTFTLLQTYERDPAPIWHFDLYRLERPEEVTELGLEEALAEAISLIEWPDRLGPRMPSDRLEVHLAFAESPQARRATLIARGSWCERLDGLAPHG